jgi:hypothetical protein
MTETVSTHITKSCLSSGDVKDTHIIYTNDKQQFCHNNKALTSKLLFTKTHKNDVHTNKKAKILKLNFLCQQQSNPIPLRQCSRLQCTQH